MYTKHSPPKSALSIPYSCPPFDWLLLGKLLKYASTNNIILNASNTVNTNLPLSFFC